MSKKNEHELNPKTPTRELEYGGVGEAIELPEEAEKEDEKSFRGFKEGGVENEL